MSKVAVIMPAAGTGARMGGVRKPFIELGGRTVLDWALAAFLARRDVVEVVVALGAGGYGDRLARTDERVRLVRGGASRFESVGNALACLQSDAGVVAVHDGARPFPSPAVIDDCIRLAARGCGAVAGIPAVDTVKRIADGGRIAGTPRRDELWYAQTPQVFPREVLERAVARCRESGLCPTDDASMVESPDADVRMVLSSTMNLKITMPEDVVVAEAYIAKGLVTYHM